MFNQNDNDNWNENKTLTVTFSSTCPTIQLSSDSVKKSDQKRLIIASIVCLSIMILEIMGGVFSNSLAIITDAAHLFTDFGAFMVSLTAIWISNKSRNQYMNFGYHRAEVIGALLSVLLIWLITGILLYLAVQRLFHREFDINSVLMLITAIFAIVANQILACALVCRGDMLDCIKNKITPREFGINVKSALIHVLGDILHGFGVLIASLIIYYKPELKIADPICTFIFSIVVLCTTIKIMRDILRVLMEGFPSHLIFSDIQNALFAVPEVVAVHNLRMWSLTLDKVALAAHIVIAYGANPTEVLRKASEITKQFNIYETTIQVEESDLPLTIESNSNIGSYS